MRLFVALELPEAWRTAAERAQAALRAAAEPRLLRFVDPALMHLTLRFLGEVDATIAPRIEAALQREVPPLDVAISLAPAGTFGPAARTTAAWLGVDGDLVALDALVARIEHAVTAVALPAETRPFRAHLTLARVSRTATAVQRRAVAEAVARLAPPNLPAFVAREIVLVRSHLSGPQPRYEVLSRHC